MLSVVGMGSPESDNSLELALELLHVFAHFHGKLTVKIEGLERKRVGLPTRAYASRNQSRTQCACADV